MALTALFTGASGLSANSTALDVVGNNLANLNTTGYKTQRTLFKDQVYQLINPGSSGSGTAGVISVRPEFGFRGKAKGTATSGLRPARGMSLAYVCTFPIRRFSDVRSCLSLFDAVESTRERATCNGD